MRGVLKRLSSAMAASLFLATIITSAGLVYAAAGGNGGGNSGGNNGTVKINGIDASSNSNDPQQGCVFSISWWNYDAGVSVTSDVTFASKSNNYTVQPTTDHLGFTGAGTSTTANYSKQYTLSFTGSPESQGYHINVTIATTQANNTDTKSKTFWVAACATPTTPTITTAASCANTSEVVTPPSITGIVWNPNTPQTLAPNASVTFTASAAANYTLSSGAQTSWPFTNSFNPATCEQIPTPPVTKNTAPTTPIVTAAATCDNTSETIAAPVIEGVVWNQTQKILALNDSTTFTATPASGYTFTIGAQTDWPFQNTFDTSNCGSTETPPTDQNPGGGQVEGDSTTSATPTGPTFTDPTCKSDGLGSYTIPNDDGVIYKDGDGNVLSAKTYSVPAGSSISIAASPDVSHSFLPSAKTSWNHDFKAATCHGVLDDSTVAGNTTATPTTPQPQVLGDSTTLSNTGVSPVIPGIGAAAVLTAAIVVFRRSNLPRRYRLYRG